MACTPFSSYSASAFGRWKAFRPMIDPKPPPAAIDISALSLAERPAEVEKPLTELQKLLLSPAE